ncbi:hypothetical protein DH86_00000426 [Scytalidium sp. 3C]|nr:hypothetical protein DH86_00000426 [Scytalidium sp. 3C]
METITIPSPSAFLNSPVIQPAPAPAVPPPPRRRKSSVATTTKPANPVSKQKTAAGLTKPKQSKSRNGCITCKAKRLKCDETKPSCQQCHKRNVTCGGYKKDFKWRPFEETTLNNKVAAPTKTKPRSTSINTNVNTSNTTSQELSPEKLSKSPTFSDGSTTPSPTQEPDTAMQDPFFSAAPPDPTQTTGPPDDPFVLPPDGLDPALFRSPVFDAGTPPFLREQLRQQQKQQTSRRIFEADSVTSSLSSLFEDDHPFGPQPLASRRATTSGQSPSLMDLLLPGTELEPRSSSLPTLSMGLTTPLLNHQFNLGPDISDPTAMDEDIEEIIREAPHQGPSSLTPWLMSDNQNQSQRHYNLQQFPFQSAMISSPTAVHRDDPFSAAHRLYQQPEIPAGSPEMLMLRFDKHTCGILSVKDGPTENPWRTLVWPLARDSPALYHAIASMTAFHTSKERPHLRVEGMEHMRRSIRALATGIDKMRVDTALATTLVLAFSESWDQHISTGIEHLRGARILVNQALAKHGPSLNRGSINGGSGGGSFSGEDLQRLRFLCNTWVYMDVISRLTSVEEDESVDFERALAPLAGFSGPALPLNPNSASASLINEIDPLMGCASTLFPLIGRVANLCRKVRNSESNSIAIISAAINLKESIENWSIIPSQFARPEDPSSDILHAIQTAEAYRYATLLFLHQAVPEIPSLSSAVLAKKVLVYLATVPLSSRLVIVQIYPLLAAGCEVDTREDREWVKERWQSMSRRMWIGNVDRCWEVIQEVWSRRDEFYAAKEENDRKRREQRGGGGAAGKNGLDELDDTSAQHLNQSSMPGTSGASGGGSTKSGGRRAAEEPITEDIDPELTVRGRLHWVGVMKEPTMS